MDSHDGHDHRRRKRAVPDNESYVRISVDIFAYTVHVFLQFNFVSKYMITNVLCFQPNKCYNADEILAIYNARNTDTLTKKNFLELCPSLIYQQVSKACAPLPQQGSKPKLTLDSSEGPNISISFEESSFVYYCNFLAFYHEFQFYLIFVYPLQHTDTGPWPSSQSASAPLWPYSLFPLPTQSV